MLQRPAILAVAISALGASTAAAQDTTLSVEESSEYGQYIAGPEGAPVYMFTTDTQGDGDQPSISCTSQECLEAWPLVTADGDVTVGSDLDPDLVGTVDHDGQTVVTYNGWPLYTFARDNADGEPQGQDISSFGGEWYLLSPQGGKLEEEGE